MRVLRAWFAVLVIYAAPVAVFAREMPRYEAGQAFVFDNGRVERVESVSGSRITWVARSGRRYVRDTNPIVPILEWSYRGQSGTRRIVGDAAGVWPLTAGRTARFQAINETRDDEQHIRRSVHLWTCTVRAERQVIVPAGSFAAFPIMCDRFSPESMRVLERITWDYAPEVGHYIRREARNMRTGERDVYSLYSALPPRAANPVRVEVLAQQALRESRNSREN